VRAASGHPGGGDAEDVLDGLKGLRRGRITLAVVSTAKYFVPRLLARFGKNHPQLDIRLTVNNRDSVIEQLIANEVDLAIMGRSPQSLDTLAEPFAQNPHVIIAAHDHPLARRRKIPVATVLAGGYARRVKDTVRIHVNTILTARDVALAFPSASVARS
jgi:DNA-binding transcriptional LysR family regulator